MPTRQQNILAAAERRRQNTIASGNTTQKNLEDTNVQNLRNKTVKTAPVKSTGPIPLVKPRTAGQIAADSITAPTKGVAGGAVVKTPNPTVIAGGSEAAAQRRLEKAKAAGNQELVALEEKNVAFAQKEAQRKQELATAPTTPEPVAPVAPPPETPEEQKTAVQQEVDTAQTVGAQALDTRQQFLTGFGDSQDQVAERLSLLEEAGAEIKTEDPQLKAQLDEVLKSNPAPEAIDEVLKKFVKTDAQVSQEADIAAAQEQAKMNGVSQENLDAATKAFENGTLNQQEYIDYLERAKPTATDKVVAETQFPEFTYKNSPEVTIANFFNDLSDTGVEGISAMVKNLMPAGSDFSSLTSAEMNQILLTQLTLESGSRIQSEMNTTFATMAERAKDAYLATIDNVDTATKEIDAIISDKSTTATTVASLQAKIAKQEKDLGMISLESTEEALNAEYSFTYNRMLEQNSRLEGYMKAKLNYQGAADSSAGLSLMNTVIDQSQQRLLLYQAKHSAEMVQLEVAKTGLMNDYFNRVQEQLIGVQGQKASALASLNDALDKIDLDSLNSKKEAETMALTALTSLTTNLYSIGQDKKEWEYKIATDMYNRAMDEMQISRDVEKAAKADAGNTMDLLLSAYGGLTFDQVDKEAQEAMVKLAGIMGLPPTFPRSALQSILRGAKPTGGGGGRGGSSTGSGLNEFGWNSTRAGIYEEVINYAEKNDMGYGEALDILYPGYGTGDYGDIADEIQAYILSAPLPEESTQEPAKKTPAQWIKNAIFSLPGIGSRPTASSDAVKAMTPDERKSFYESGGRVSN